MWLFKYLFLSSWTFWIFAFENKFVIIQENVTLVYIDHRVLDTTLGIYKLNETTNGLNMTFRFKVDLPERAKAYVTAFKWINNDYRLGFLQFGKTFKDGLEMESFDLQALFVDHTRPPLVWPLQKGIVYRCLGWSPDSGKFPQNLPEGRWKVELLFSFANKTNFLVTNWFITLVYQK